MEPARPASDVAVGDNSASIATCMPTEDSASSVASFMATALALR